MTRHPEVAKRKSQRMNPGRAMKLNKFIANDYFVKLRNILVEMSLMTFPEKIFNMDEKGCRLHLHKDPQVYAKKGSKRVHYVSKEHGESVTIVGCGNAIGTVITPIILFKGKRMKPEWKDKLPTGSDCLMTPKGCMTTEAFCVWLKHFSRFKPNGPCLLIFDGAISHLDYSIVEKAEDFDIKLFCLPSNTTHELQPLDKSCYGPFETFWDEQVLLYLDQTSHDDITKARFGKIFSPVWDKVMKPENVKSGFKGTGIYPFNPNVIPEQAFAPSDVTETEAPNPVNAPNQPSNSSSLLNLPSSSFTSPSSSVMSPSELITSSPLSLPPRSFSNNKKQHSSISSSSDSSIDLGDLSDLTSEEEPEAQTSFQEIIPTPVKKKKLLE